MAALQSARPVGASRRFEWLLAGARDRAMVLMRGALEGLPCRCSDGVTGAVTTTSGLRGLTALVEQTLDQPAWEAAKDLLPRPPLGPAAPSGSARLRRGRSYQSRRSARRGKRFVSDTAEIRAVVVRRILEKIGERLILMWFDDLYYSSASTFERFPRLHREAPGPACWSSRRRAEAEDARDRPRRRLRMESLRAEWGGKVMELRPLGTDETESLLRATLPLHDDAVARILRARGTRSSRSRSPPRLSKAAHLAMEHLPLPRAGRRSRGGDHDRGAVGRAVARGADEPPRGGTRRRRSATTFGARC